MLKKSRRGEGLNKGNTVGGIAQKVAKESSQCGIVNKLFFGDQQPQNYQFSEVLLLMNMFHFSKCSSCTPGKKIINLQIMTATARL